MAIHGQSRRCFFILSTNFNPLRCLNTSKYFKTDRLTSPAMQQVRAGRYRSFEFVCSSRRPHGVSFQYLYRLLWRIPIVKWNSLKRVVLDSILCRTEMPTGVFSIISFQYLYRLLWRKFNSLERVVLNLTGCFERTVNVYFYLLFVFTSWWCALLTGRHIRR